MTRIDQDGTGLGHKKIKKLISNWLKTSKINWRIFYNQIEAKRKANEAVAVAAAAAAAAASAEQIEMRQQQVRYLSDLKLSSINYLPMSNMNILSFKDKMRLEQLKSKSRQEQSAVASPGDCMIIKNPRLFC